MPLLQDCIKVYKIQESLVSNSNIIYRVKTSFLPRWKDLTDLQKVSLFFEFFTDERWRTFTLCFSKDFVNNCKNYEKKADFI